MAQRSAKHHTVPQAILKNFCYSGAKLFYYSKDRHNEGIASRDVSKKFFRWHYYSVTTSAGERSDQFEREFLQKIDSQFSIFIRELIDILDSGRLPRWPSLTGDFARQFIYYYQKRSPDFYDSLGPGKTVDEVLKEAESDLTLSNIPGRDEFFQRLEKNPNYRGELAQFARVQAMSMQSPLVLAKLEMMSLSIAKAPPKSSFIVGSHPVARLGGDGELGNGTVELWTPVSSKYCLGLFGANREEEHSIFELTQRKVRRLNNAIFRQSRQVGAASETLLKSIVTTKHQDYN